MNVLIVYAHPNAASFNSAILEQVKRGLAEGKNNVTVVDLYEDNFDPVLRYGGDVTRSDLKHDVETSQYRNQVAWADHLIFIYPIWWYGLPAILKGFLDRVLVSGFAFRYEGHLPKGLLSRKSAWVVYTIDSPGFFVRLFRRSAEWTVMRDAVLKFCGITRTRRMMFAGVKGSSLHRREKWLSYVYQQARQL